MKKYFPVLSLIFGIVSLLSSLLFYPITRFFSSLFSVPLISIFDTFSKYYLQHLFIFFSFFGLILGVSSIKLKFRKNNAILGTVFSAIALLIWLFIWLLLTSVPIPA